MLNIEDKYITKYNNNKKNIGTMSIVTLLIYCVQWESTVLNAFLFINFNILAFLIEIKCLRQY